MSEGSKPTRPRMTAFRWGVVAGLSPAVLFVVVLKPWIGLAEPAFNVAVETSGLDVGRHGGVRVIVENGQGVVTDEMCRDECDDLHLQARSADNAYKVSVLDRRGAVIASSDDIYVTNGYAASVTRFTVAGANTLKVLTEQVDP